MNAEDFSHALNFPEALSMRSRTLNPLLHKDLIISISMAVMQKETDG
jgi:hypothetical protein